MYPEKHPGLEDLGSLGPINVLGILSVSWSDVQWSQALLREAAFTFRQLKWITGDGGGVLWSPVVISGFILSIYH